MGTAGMSQPHKLIIPVLFASERQPDEVQSLVEDVFGEIDSTSELISFEFTDYYSPEMGRPIFRQLYSISRLVQPEDLAACKQRSNEVEQATARPEGTRTVNLDPGLLSLSRIILASTKPSAHRISIGHGIHAEITLLFRKGAYIGLEWTYPDFDSKAYIPWLLAVRKRYHEQLKELDPNRAWRL